VTRRHGGLGPGLSIVRHRDGPAEGTADDAAARDELPGHADIGDAP